MTDDPTTDDESLSFTILGVAAWAVTLATALAIVVQRWSEPHLARNVALVVLGVLALAADDVVHIRASHLVRIPEIAWCLPTVVAVLVLVTTPTTTDFAPFLLVMITARAVLYGKVLDGALVWAASVGVMIAVEVTGDFSGSLIWVLGISFGWLGGFATRSMLLLLEELRAAQADLATRAAAGERQRIAREIHDVIAHSLSVASLHITGARMAVKRDPAEAEEALAQAERLTRDSLSQVRSVIGVLSPATDGTAPAMPTLVDIPRLLADFRDAGMDVELHVDGDIGPLLPAIELAVYRVVQESLSNVARHCAGASACVSTSVSGDVVTVTVTNPLTNGVVPGVGGRGIQGMRERAAAHDGTLEVGPVDGYWRVRLTLPTKIV